MGERGHRLPFELLGISWMVALDQPSWLFKLETANEGFASILAAGVSGQASRLSYGC